MTKTLKIAIGAAAALVLVAGTGGVVMAAREQGPMGPGGFMGRRGPGGPGGPLGLLPGLRALNLSDSQREQLKATMDAHRAAFEQQAGKQRAARKALHDAITAETFDEAAVRQKAADLAVVEADGAVLRAKVHSEAWALLTPEQKQKANELKAQAELRRGRMREQFEQRRGARDERRRQRPAQPGQ